MLVQFGLPEIAFRSGDSISKITLFDGPLEISWHHCAITSDFLADFYAQRLHVSDKVYKHSRHNIGYLANELIENAIKFRACGDVIIEALMDSENFMIKVTNEVDEASVGSFESYLEHITSGDPGELLIQKIEHNAENPNLSASGLGLLTLMGDYGSRLAWRFDRSEAKRRMRVETFGSMSIVAEQQ